MDNETKKQLEEPDVERERGCPTWLIELWDSVKLNYV